MDNKFPIEPPVHRFSDQMMVGCEVVHSSRKLNDLADIFVDREAIGSCDPDTPVYEVDAYMPVAEGVSGGLYLGVTRILPGKVGREYFMTKGHFHRLETRPEFYWGMQGEGVLLTMDRNCRVRAEAMFAGSIHYIAGGLAHRVVNTGNAQLSFGACWPSDAGHNYEEILHAGFPVSVQDRDGEPALIEL